jgi:hypothetical protein
MDDKGFRLEDIISRLVNYGNSSIITDTEPTTSGRVVISSLHTDKHAALNDDNWRVPIDAEIVASCANDGFPYPTKERLRSR